MKTTRMGKDFCPVCKHMVDCASGMEDKPDYIPVPGHLAVCLYCAAINQYGSDMALHILPKVVWDTIPKDIQEKVMRMQIAVISTIAKPWMPTHRMN